MANSKSKKTPSKSNTDESLSLLWFFIFPESPPPPPLPGGDLDEKLIPKTNEKKNFWRKFKGISNHAFGCYHLVNVLRSSLTLDFFLS